MRSPCDAANWLTPCPDNPPIPAARFVFQGHLPCSCFAVIRIQALHHCSSAAKILDLRSAKGFVSIPAGSGRFGPGRRVSGTVWKSRCAHERTVRRSAPAAASGLRSTTGLRGAASSSCQCRVCRPSSWTPCGEWIAHAGAGRRWGACRGRTASSGLPGPGCRAPVRDRTRPDAPVPAPARARTPKR